jgi:hypothetical protein
MNAVVDIEGLFPCGCQVNVAAGPDDVFIHDFTGHVVGYHGPYVVVKDQDDEAWDCEPAQISHSSDSIMHD